MSEKNSVVAITDKIQAEAQTWADEQTVAAKAEAAATAAEYEALAKAAYDGALADAQLKVKATAERAVSQSDMDRRGMLLAARQECVGIAFDKALEQLCALSEEERALLMIKSAVQYQTRDAEYIFNAADQATVGPLVVETVNALLKKQQLKETLSGSLLEQLKKLVTGGAAAPFAAAMSKQVGSFAGGFILKQGDIEINCTFEVLISGVRENLEGETSAILFS